MGGNNGHPASLQCTGCGKMFRCSARRVRMVVEGRASRLCDYCREHGRRAGVVVLPEHKEWWRKKMERGDRTRAGELITLEWVESVVGEMEQMKW